MPDQQDVCQEPGCGSRRWEGECPFHLCGVLIHDEAPSWCKGGKHHGFYAQSPQEGSSEAPLLCVRCGLTYLDGVHDRTLSGPEPDHGFEPEPPTSDPESARNDSDRATAATLPSDPVQEAREEVTENTYYLCENIYGMTRAEVDAFYETLGLSPTLHPVQIRFWLPAYRAGQQDERNRLEPPMTDAERAGWNADMISIGIEIEKRDERIADLETALTEERDRVAATLEDAIIASGALGHTEDHMRCEGTKYDTTHCPLCRVLAAALREVKP